jgi:hypothetical protein
MRPRVSCPAHHRRLERRPQPPDIAERAHNTNAPQLIDTDVANGQITQRIGAKDRLISRYQFTDKR